MSRTRDWGRIVIATLGLATSPMLLAQGIIELDFGVETEDGMRRLRVGEDGRILIEVRTSNPQSPSFCGLYGLDRQGDMLSPFGSNGRLSLENHCSRALLLRPDGSFLVASNQHLDFRSASGEVIGAGVEFAQPSYIADIGSDVALAEQSDGKLLVGGATVGCVRCDWLLARFNTDGTPDISFGSGGIVTMNLSAGNDSIASVHALSSGKILVSGTADDSDEVIMRLNPDGQIDATFGANGSVHMSGNRAVTQLDSLGRIYLQDGWPTRLSADGTLDGSYTPTIPYGTYPTLTNFVIDASDRVVMFGVTGSPLAGSIVTGYVARFDTSGALDTSFNGTGQLLLRFATVMTDYCYGGVDGNQPVVACSVKQVADYGLNARSNVALQRLTESGAVETTFGINQTPFDAYPDAYSFPPQTVPYGTAEVTSAPVTITGTTMPARIVINAPDTNVGYSIGCNGTFTYLPGVISSGEQVCIRTVASNEPGGSRQPWLQIGGRAATFVVNSSNSPADSVPDAFAFVNQSDVSTSTSITSNIITVQGITGFSTVSVQNGAYSLGCAPQGFTTEATTVTNGATICVRHDSSASANTQTATTLTVSGVSAVFTSTTKAATTPPPSNPSSNPPSSGGGGGGGSMNFVSLAMLAMLSALSRRYGRHARR